MASELTREKTSYLQLESQPSRPRTLPSSHCSTPSMRPLPHVAGSMMHVDEQPSPDAVLPSSHVSGGSTTLLPQRGGQSSSTSALPVGGQQPSSFVGIVIAGNVHVALHVPLLTSVSVVHAIPSLHEVGQLPAPLAIAVSQSSPDSTTPSPQPIGQSVSVA